jgi:hypothetical protein
MIGPHLRSPVLSRYRRFRSDHPVLYALIDVAWTVALVVISWTNGHATFAIIAGSLMAFGIVVGDEAECCRASE